MSKMPYTDVDFVTDAIWVRIWPVVSATSARTFSGVAKACDDSVFLASTPSASTFTRKDCSGAVIARDVACINAMQMVLSLVSMSSLESSFVSRIFGVVRCRKLMKAAPPSVNSPVDCWVAYRSVAAPLSEPRNPAWRGKNGYSIELHAPISMRHTCGH